MSISTERFILKVLLLAALVLWAFAGCSSAPPGTYSAGFMGAQVQYSTPGWSAPAKVVPSAAITTPALLVPADSPVANELTATVQGNGTTTSVPIVVAPVAKAVLAVPAK
jgi:hypothetical protein